jgi:hypothetical protein
MLTSSYVYANRLATLIHRGYKIHPPINQHLYCHPLRLVCCNSMPVRRQTHHLQFRKTGASSRLSSPILDHPFDYPFNYLLAIFPPILLLSFRPSFDYSSVNSLTVLLSIVRLFYNQSFLAQRSKPRQKQQAIQGEHDFAPGPATILCHCWIAEPSRRHTTRYISQHVTYISILRK